MLRGLYTSAMGMNVQMQTLDVISNNMSNANTTGFRSSVAVHQSFPELLAKNLHAIPGHAAHSIYNVGRPSFGVTVSGVHTNFSQGTLQQTSGELDLALSGPGFFAVESVNAAGEPTQLFTRNGSFTLDAENNLITLTGERVLDTSGNHITLPEGNINILNNGEIQIDDETQATIRITNFENENMLRSFGYNMFVALEGAEEIDFTGNVNQGHLERSNVNIVQEMVRMVNVSRAYELNQRMVSIHDQTLGQAVTEIARR